MDTTSGVNASKIMELGEGGNSTYIPFDSKYSKLGHLQKVFCEVTWMLILMMEK